MKILIHFDDLNAWTQLFIQVENKSQILQWHHENVAVACLSADEGHTPPRDPQDKLHLLKLIQILTRNSDML